MLKIMIVDDEKSVLKGLQHILKKHCPNYEIASMVQSANEAIYLLEKTEIDVVITDVMMPEMNGVELTQKIKKNHPQISVIVLSGYDDFEFVRQAMKNGAFDYLLKPCRYQIIIELLQKIETNLVVKERENEKVKNRQLMERVLTGKEHTPEEWLVGSEMHMAVISAIGNVNSLFEKHYLREVERIAASQWIDTLVVDHYHVMIFRKAFDMTIMKKKLYQYRQQFCTKSASEYLAFHSFKIGDHCIMHAFETCKRMIEFMEFNELFSVIDDVAYLDMIKRQKSVSMVQYFSGKVIGKSVLGYDDRKLVEDIHSKLTQLQQLDVFLNPIYVKREVICEIAYLEQVLKEHGLEPNIGYQGDIIEEIKNLKTLREMMNLLKGYVITMLVAVQDVNETPHYIRAAIKYIDLHYMEDLSLKMVAEAVYLNPWYFSTQFKKYMSKSFSEYLNQVRVRMAKNLLRQKDLKVYQVAEMVGFQDAAYFSTVFKNVERISPKEFQKTV